jgi:hypothetical protein
LESEGDDTGPSSAGTMSARQNMNLTHPKHLQRIGVAALILVAAALILVVEACKRDAAMPQHMSAKGELLNEKVRDVVALLDAMPAWATGDPIKPETCTAIKSKCEAIRVRFSHSIIRDAIVHVLQAADFKTETQTASKVFVLNRFLFEVPNDADAATIRYFGGWAGVPIKNGRVDMLWPWCQGTNGLELENSFKGYFGEGYDGVGEFDYFKTHYDARKQ